MCIIAFVTDAAFIARILSISVGSHAPPIAAARGPPAWEDAHAPVPDWDLLGQPEPDFEFDQRIAW